jgi:hypothetical protein
MYTYGMYTSKIIDGGFLICSTRNLVDIWIITRVSTSGNQTCLLKIKVSYIICSRYLSQEFLEVFKIMKSMDIQEEGRRPRLLHRYRSGSFHALA